MDCRMGPATLATGGAGMGTACCAGKGGRGGGGGIVGSGIAVGLW